MFMSLVGLARTIIVPISTKVFEHSPGLNLAHLQSSNSEMSCLQLHSVLYQVISCRQ